MPGNSFADFNDFAEFNDFWPVNRGVECLKKALMKEHFFAAQRADKKIRKYIPAGKNPILGG